MASISRSPALSPYAHSSTGPGPRISARRSGLLLGPDVGAVHAPGQAAVGSGLEPGGDDVVEPGQAAERLEVGSESDADTRTRRWP